MVDQVETLYMGGKSFYTIREEEVYGTYHADGSDIKWVISKNFEAQRKNNMYRSYGHGGGRNPKQIVPGKYGLSGPLEFEVQNLRLLALAIGNVGSWAYAGGTWTRTLGAATPSYHPLHDLDGNVISSGAPPTTLNYWHVREADQLTPFSIDETIISEAGTYDNLIRYLGCKVNTFSLDADVDKPFRCSLDWIAQKDAIITNQSTITEPTSPGGYTDPVYMFYKGQFQFNGTTAIPTGDTLTAAETAGPAKVGGTPKTVTAANSISVKCNQNLEPYYSVNRSSGRGVQSLIEKNREYQLTFDLNYATNDMLMMFYDGTLTSSSPTVNAPTASQVQIDYQTPNTTTIGNAFKQIRVMFSDLYIDEHTLPSNPEDIRKQSITAIARKVDAFAISSEAL